LSFERTQEKLLIKGGYKKNFTAHPAVPLHFMFDFQFHCNFEVIVKQRGSI